MFEDLVPPAPAQPPAPPPGVFDDLIAAGTPAAAAGKLAAPGGAGEPALPRSTAGTDPGDASIAAPARNGELALAPSDQTNARDDSPPAAGSFDDLIPAAARRGGAVGGQQGALAPPYEPVPDPSLGLKDAKTGIPLVRESMPGRFIADVAGEDDGGLFWHDPKTGEIQRPSGNELIQAEGGKYKVYERDENIRPWTWTDMALIQAIKSGFTAPYDALAGNMAPNEVIPRALDFASFAGGRSPVTTWISPRHSHLATMVRRERLKTLHPEPLHRKAKVQHVIPQAWIPERPNRRMIIHPTKAARGQARRLMKPSHPKTAPHRAPFPILGIGLRRFQVSASRGDLGNPGRRQSGMMDIPSNYTITTKCKTDRLAN
jgi:hypothetical protein